ncbi:hypothetical protein [Jeongeupia naejangsanensis]|uniref:Uncharacterized protein n=1 Tax=Jeongeupia naejangsanensis TaxID=613195 RepID=A0ABS2BHM1_9NEIS|nr:hypothetical protein [Jeongeupia naejangsanensis]MBM3115098.1 hypothetical protein [Jeongeupia naejangsanensis]
MQRHRTACGRKENFNFIHHQVSKRKHSSIPGAPWPRSMAAMPRLCCACSRSRAAESILPLRTPSRAAIGTRRIVVRMRIDRMPMQKTNRSSACLPLEGRIFRGRDAPKDGNGPIFNSYKKDA